MNNKFYFRKLIQFIYRIIVYKFIQTCIIFQNGGHFYNLLQYVISDVFEV